MEFYDDADSLESLMGDAEDPDNPQRGIPDSVRESAIRELKRRGYSDAEITDIRLGNYHDYLKEQ